MKTRPVVPSLLATLFLSSSLPGAPQWEQESLSLPRSELVACSSGTTALFAGGERLIGEAQDRVDLYDAATDTWRIARLSAPRENPAAAAAGGRILIAGGQSVPDYSDVVDIYDTANGTWSTATLSLARDSIGAGSVAGQAFFAGGTTASGKTDCIDIYTAATNSWSTATLSVPRSSIQVVTIGSRIFFAGGLAYSSTPVDTIDVYDSTSGTWSMQRLPGSIPLTAATAVGNLAFFALSSGTVWIYDDSAGNWRTTFLSSPRDGLTSTAVGTRVLFAGGVAGLARATVDIYDTVSQAWQVASLSSPRYFLASTTVAGRAIFAGGHEDWMTLSAAVDIYTPGPGHGFCAGEGLGTPCPCANEGLAGQGCSNSTGGGALLTSLASASVSAADLGFTLTGAVSGEPAVLFAARDAVNGGLGIAFGDGLRCAGGPAVRLDSQLVDGDGTVVWDPAPYGGWHAGNVRRFQVYYRDPTGPCGSTFNLSNGVEVQFVP